MQQKCFFFLNLTAAKNKKARSLSLWWSYLAVREMFGQQRTLHTDTEEIIGLRFRREAYLLSHALLHLHLSVWINNIYHCCIGVLSKLCGAKLPDLYHNFRGLSHFRGLQLTVTVKPEIIHTPGKVWLKVTLIQPASCFFFFPQWCLLYIVLLSFGRSLCPFQ